jgi:hypothetical protein
MFSEMLNPGCRVQCKEYRNAKSAGVRKEAQREVLCEPLRSLRLKNPDQLPKHTTHPFSLFTIHH